ncbi:MAG: hypothetical protein KCHDKBKB_01983 [Elusimicrobia bacterium]|nr:hypothetical protein [Elusimicrobiota bacterium]
MKSNARKRLLVFFVPLLLALPFLGRAYFVDDSYFVEIASWLKDQPTLPYHFRTDDAGLQNRGWEENGFVRMVNPLAHHYYLALLLKIFGEKEFFLRLGCVFLSCFSALFLFEFARRWTSFPLLTTLLILVTPAQWLTSYSLLIDSTMVFFSFGALYFFIKGTESGGVWRWLLSGLMAGLAILSKYPALFILPLMMVWLLFRWKYVKTDRGWILSFVVPILFLLGYSLWTAQLYGRPHILAASNRMVHVFGWPKVFSFFVFFSGAILLPLLSWGVVSRTIQGMSLLGVLLLSWGLSTPWGGFTAGQAFLLALWVLTSFIFIWAILKFRPQWIFPRDPFLVLWVLGFIGMMLLVMDWVAVRYYCLVTPAVVMLMVRLLENKGTIVASKVLPLALGGLFLFTAGLAVSDYQQAEPTRLVRSQLLSDGIKGGPRSFYLGDSFTMSYLKRDGWIPCFPETVFQKGDLILAKEVTMPLVWFARKPLSLRRVATYEYPSWWPLKVMDYKGSAGFYASVWGALPFTFSKGPWERFYVFEVVGLRPHDHQ